MLIIVLAILTLPSAVLLLLSLIMVRKYRTQRGTDPIDGKEKIWRRIRLVSACIFLIGIASSLSVPNEMISGQMARRAACISHLKQLTMAVLIYQDEHNVYPKHLSQLAPILSEDDNTFRLLTCPFKKHINPITADEIDEKTDYLYRPPSTDGDTLPILADKLGNHGFGSISIAFIDGHAETTKITPETIALIKKAFGDTAITQEYINYINRSKLQIAIDDTVEFVEYNLGAWLLLLLFLVPIAAYAAVAFKIRRYEKEYKKTPAWEEVKAKYITLIVIKYAILILTLLLLASMFIPALQ